MAAAPFICRNSLAGATFACLVVACTSGNGVPGSLAPECSIDTTAIAAVQGRDFTSPIEGQTTTVKGVVTLVVADGLYLESLTPDDSSATSEGLFLFTDGNRDVSIGQVLVASGTVSERGERRDTMTSLEGLSTVQTCGTTALPLGRMSLPMAESQRETIEGMRLAIGQNLAITDVYALRFGDIIVSADGPLPAPTEVAIPGEQALDQSRHNLARSVNVRLPEDLEPTFPIGTSLSGMRGVLGHDGRAARLLLDLDPSFTTPPLPALKPPGDGQLRVVSMNLLNYFNGDGLGNGFPTARGAETAEEFKSQRQRLRAAVKEMQPHVVGVMEIENDGFGANSAAYDFVRDLRAASPGNWQPVGLGLEMIGTDQITVGLFYREDEVEPVGEPILLLGKVFEWGNRVPLAQVFSHRASGERFLVVVNHFKSKGSCPDDGPNANQRDGQACWNKMRTQAADALAGTARRLAEQSTGGRALLLGDFNAYRMEDPIRNIVDAGFVDLTGSIGAAHEYTYSYRGQTGSLDYAFSTPALQDDVWRASVHHINAAYPPGIDLQPQWLRYSDHDPVVIDFRFRQSSTID